MADPSRILDDLNPAQREAARAVRGPVAILAGAGSGKTTTITHRIAYQVATGTFDADRILAVTFTEKAARELRERLRALGVQGVEARTFHAAALSQLSRLWRAHAGSDLPELLEAKAPLIASLANALPPPHRFVARSELAGEIEWAKNRMVAPDGYLRALEETAHAPPIPAALMHRVYEGYERRKRSARRIDFEDILAMAVDLLGRHPDAAAEVRRRFQAFTVDEFQDVNPLQAALLDRWLGDRDEVCVVGDDYQTIYSFTGATPRYLLRFRDRFPQARVVTLEDNYRSTPEVLATANRLADRLGGFRKTLRPTRQSGPAPALRPTADAAAETAFVVERVRALHRGEGIPLEEIAVLYRINARSGPFEEAFAAARIPYQVRDGAFLRRPGPRSVLHRLRRESGGVSPAVDRVTSALGFDPDGAADSPEEATRQADLARLRVLAAEFEAAHTDGDLAAFAAELARRFSTEQTGRGVNLLTYHRAKGLEFDAVFLPRLLDGELPFRTARTRADETEERRLLYVGITRARTHLFMTWPRERRQRRSPFLDEIDGGVDEAVRSAGPAPRAPAAAMAAEGTPLYEALKRWRLQRSQADGVPAYVVFPNRVLGDIAERRPRSRMELLDVSGVGPAKVARYGEDVLRIVAEDG